MLDVVLRGPEGPQPVGAPVRVSVEVRNRGPREAWAVGVLDGSEDGLRYPRYRPSITLDGRVVAEPGPAEDPLVGPLRPSDIRRLGPGEGFDPTAGPDCLPLFTFHNHTPGRPGLYRFALTLSTESPSPEDWLGRIGQEEWREEALRLVPRVERTTVRAAPLEVEVR